MENKLEFLYGPVVPLYRWKQYDTKRTNWNYYKQYAIAPCNDWNYKVYNCENDVTHYGYKQKVVNSNRPKYSYTIDRVMDADLYASGDNQYRQTLLPAQFGTNNGNWAYNLEASYRHNNPSSIEVPDAYKKNVTWDIDQIQLDTLYFRNKADYKGQTVTVYVNSILNPLAVYNYSEKWVGVDLSSVTKTHETKRIIITDWYEAVMEPTSYTCRHPNEFTSTHLSESLYINGKIEVTRNSDNTVNLYNALNTYQWQERPTVLEVRHPEQAHPITTESMTFYRRHNTGKRTSATTVECQGTIQYTGQEIEDINKYMSNGDTFADNRYYPYITQIECENSYNNLNEWKQAGINNNLKISKSYSNKITLNGMPQEIYTAPKLYEDNNNYNDGTTSFTYEYNGTPCGGDAFKQEYALTPLSKAGFKTFNLREPYVEQTSYNLYVDNVVLLQSFYYSKFNKLLDRDHVIHMGQFIGWETQDEYESRQATTADGIQPKQSLFPWANNQSHTQNYLVPSTSGILGGIRYNDFYGNRQVWTGYTGAYREEVPQLRTNEQTILVIDFVNQNDPVATFATCETPPYYASIDGCNITGSCKHFQELPNRTWWDDTTSSYITLPENQVVCTWDYSITELEGHQKQHILLYNNNTNRIHQTIDNYIEDINSEYIPTNGTISNHRIIGIEIIEEKYNSYSQYYERTVSYQARVRLLYAENEFKHPCYYRPSTSVVASDKVETGLYTTEYGDYDKYYLLLHGPFTPKPYDMSVVSEEIVDITNTQIRDGYFTNYFDYNFERYRQNDYIVAGSQAGEHYYGESDFNKISKIYDDGWKRSHTYSFTEDPNMAWPQDFGQNIIVNTPTNWITGANYIGYTKPESGAYITTVYNTDTHQTYDTTIWFQFQTEAPHTAQPYQPLNGTLVSTTHKEETAITPTPPCNAQGPNTNNTLWEVFAISRYTGHPTTFMKYVESMNVNDYPSPNTPEYDPVTDTWADGYKNGYWYERRENSTIHQKTLYDKDLKDGVNLDQSVNSASDLTYGTASSAEIKFNYYNPTDNADQYLNKTCNWYQKHGTEDYQLKGQFTLLDMSQKRDYTNFVGYDNMVFTDIIADSFIAATTFPISAKEMFEDLCVFCGLDYEDDCIQSSDPTETATYFPSANHQIYNNFTSTNITVRQIYSYLAELLNCFFAIGTDGKIYAGKYLTTEIDWDNEDYSEYTKSVYDIGEITKVVIKANDQSGFVEGDDDGDTYFLSNNPLLYAETKAEVQDILNNTLAAFNDLSYTPGTVKTLYDKGVNVGDIITIDDNTFYVMKKTSNNNGVTLECIGSQNRQSSYQTQDTQIIALRGITANLDTLTQTLDIDMTDISERFANVTGKISTLNGQVNGNEREIDNIQEDITTINNTLNAHSSSISSLGTRMTTAESNISTNTTNIATNTSNITSNTSRIAQNEATLTLHNTAITNNENTINAVSTREIQDVEQLQSSVNLKMDKTDMKSQHMAATGANYGTFIGTSGIYYCEVNSLNLQPTRIIYYINWQEGKTNLTLTTDAWSGTLPQDIIW